MLNRTSTTSANKLSTENLMQKIPQQIPLIIRTIRFVGLLGKGLREVWLWTVASWRQVGGGTEGVEYNAMGRAGIRKNKRFLAVQSAHSAALEVLSLLDPDSHDALPTQDGSTCFPNRDEFNQDSAEMTRLQVLQSAGISELGHSHTINQSILALLQ